MLGAENGRFTRNCRVARPVNALFAILPILRFSNGLKAFDNFGKVLLGRRFRPLAHPCEWRSVLVIAGGKQSLQSRNRLVFQSIDNVFLRPLPGASTRREANLSSVMDAGSKTRCSRK